MLVRLNSRIYVLRLLLLQCHRQYVHGQRLW